MNKEHTKNCPKCGEKIIYGRKSTLNLSIKENRDAKISSTCPKNPKKAYFVLKVKLVENK